MNAWNSSAAIMVVGVLYGKGQPKPLLDEAAAKVDQILKD